VNSAYPPQSPVVTAQASYSGDHINANQSFSAIVDDSGASPFVSTVSTPLPSSYIPVSRHQTVPISQASSASSPVNATYSGQSPLSARIDLNASHSREQYTLSRVSRPGAIPSASMISTGSGSQRVESQFGKVSINKL
jgi:hypothetical protein